MTSPGLILHHFSFNMSISGADIPKGGLEPLLCASKMRNGVKDFIIQVKSAY